VIPDEKWTTEDAGVWSTKRRENRRVQLCAYLEAEQKRSLEERRRKMVAEMKLKRVDSYFQLLAVDGQFLLTVGEGLSMFAPVNAVELESCPQSTQENTPAWSGTLQPIIAHRRPSASTP